MTDLFSYHVEPTGENPMLAFGVVAKSGEPFRFSFKNGTAQLTIYPKDFVVDPAMPEAQRILLADCPEGSAAWDSALKYPADGRYVRKTFSPPEARGWGRINPGWIGFALDRWIKECTQVWQPSKRPAFTRAFLARVKQLDDPQLGVIAHATSRRLKEAIRLVAKLYREDCADKKQWEKAREMIGCINSEASRQEVYGRNFYLSDYPQRAADDDISYVVYQAAQAATAPDGYERQYFRPFWRGMTPVRRGIKKGWSLPKERCHCH